MDWERLQGQAAITYDKAMQSMVSAALPLCNKGTHLGCSLHESVQKFNLESTS